MAETTTFKRSNPFGNNYRVVAGNKPKVQNAQNNQINNATKFAVSLPFKMASGNYNLGDNDITKLRTMVNQRNANDRANYAYDVALNLAKRDQENDRRTRGFANFNTEADLTSKADKYYEQLMNGAEHPKGSEIRGENLFTQALGGIREGINGFNNMVGTGLDWGVDRVGDLVGAVTGRDDWKQSIQDATTGEDLAIIPDILEDIGLVALTGPVGGAALLGAKGLLQNTDNFQEALTGKDHLTGEALTGGQRLANAAAGLGGTALTMLPGFSAAKAGTKLVGNELKAGVKTAEDALAKTSDKAEQALKRAIKDGKPSDKLEKDLVKAKEARDAVFKTQPTTADILKDPTSASKFAEARENAIKAYGQARDDAYKAFEKSRNKITDLRKDVIDRRGYQKALNKAKAEQEAFAKFAPATGEEGAMTVGELIRLATRNPFSKEARAYNDMARKSYMRNLKDAYKADLEDVADAEGKITSKGSTRKAIWNILNGKTLGKAVGFDENVEALKEGIEQATKEEAKKAAKKKGVKGILDRLNNKTIRQSTKGQAGGKPGFYGPGAIKGFGLTAGSGLAEVMANEPGGFQAAINNYADRMGETPDSQLLPLALAMLPGYRKGFSRMFAGDRLPYYGVKAQLAQRGVNNVYNNRYTDEDNENLMKAIGGK